MRSASACVTEPSAAAPKIVRVLSWPVLPNGAFAITTKEYRAIESARGRLGDDLLARDRGRHARPRGRDVRLGALGEPRGARRRAVAARRAAAGADAVAARRPGAEGRLRRQLVTRRAAAAIAEVTRRGRLPGDRRCATSAAASPCCTAGTSSRPELAEPRATRAPIEEFRRSRATCTSRRTTSASGRARSATRRRPSSRRSRRDRERASGSSSTCSTATTRAASARSRASR